MGNQKLFDRAIAFNRIFVDLTGSISAALLLSQACYWSQRTRSEDGWFYKTQEEWEEETGMTRHELEGARKKAEKYLKSELRGIPAKNHYFVDWERIYQDCGISTNKFAENRQTVLPKSGKHSITENTTENTISFQENLESEEHHLLGFPVPDGYEVVDYGFDSDDVHNWVLKDQWGAKVSSSKIAQMRKEYQNKAKTPVAKKDSTEIDFERILAMWNAYPDLKSTGLSNVNNPSAKKVVLSPAKLTPDLKGLIKKYAKKYSIQEIDHAIEEYVKDILNRPEDATGYYLHRMSFYDFLYQKNGFIKFVNK